MDEYARAREQMIEEQLQKRGIVDVRVLEAFRRAPRERFVDPEQQSLAYCDRALPIMDGQTISQPYVVALMLSAAAIEPRDRVLEIGAGSGYSAALLGHLAQRVWTMERHGRLARFAGARIAELGLANVTVLRGDGTLGWPPAAPFDAILATASGPAVPEPLRLQLAIGGRLIAPVGADQSSQRLIRTVRRTASDFSEEDLGPVSFVPLVGAHGFAETIAARDQ